MVESECETMAPGLRGLGESETPGGVLISSVLNAVPSHPL